MTHFEGAPTTLGLYVAVVGFCALFWPAVAAAGAQRLRVVGGMAAFLGVLALAAGTGWTAAGLDSLPPRPAFIAIPTLILAIAFAASRTGEHIAMHRSVALLVGFQAFRLPLEIVLHQLGAAGELPVEMTWDGYNFDVITGVSAIGIAGLAATGRLHRGLLAAWNVMGMVLLFAIIVIALGSMPTRLQFIDATPPNTLALTIPGCFILLPVASALVGHILIFRRLRHL